MARDGISNYRQLRVVISPGSRELLVSVLARRVSGGLGTDRELYRFTLPRDGELDTLAECLDAVSAVLSAAADRAERRGKPLGSGAP